MTEIYKSSTGREAVRSACGRIYEAWPFKHEVHLIQSQRYGTTHVIEMGNQAGPILLLLHGTSSNSASWLGYIPSFMKEFHLIIPDLPGQPGLSSSIRPSLKDGQMLGWLEEVTDKLCPPRFSVCGMSLGSWVGTQYAARHPEKVAALCLVTSGGFTKPKAGFFFKVLPLAMLGKAGVKRINRLIAGKVELSPEVEAFGALVAEHMKPLTEPIPLFTDGEISALQMPLCYIGGEKDPMLDTRRTMLRIASLLPHAQCTSLPGVHHLVLDQGERIARFFRENQQ